LILRDFLDIHILLDYYYHPISEDGVSQVQAKHRRYTCL
jgi:hypothetical protein